jgi:hypothetical protein
MTGHKDTKAQRTTKKLDVELVRKLHPILLTRTFIRSGRSKQPDLKIAF